MTAPPDDTTTGTSAIIAALRTERDGALAREAALAEALAAPTAELAERKTEFDERSEQQAATVDVLKVMSASPGDPRPVLDTIVQQAQALCGSAIAALFQRDGAMLRCDSVVSSTMWSEEVDAYKRNFPRPLEGQTNVILAMRDRRIVHTRDGSVSGEIAKSARDLGFQSAIAVPLIKDAAAIGATVLGNCATGGFTDSQIALLQTFAEQAVIAISSAETYRALQTRTADLQESLEYQIATSDVLKVISRSTFDLQPVLAMVAETAAKLCAADQAALIRHEDGTTEMVTNSGFPPEYLARLKKLGPQRLVVDTPLVAHRTITERRVVHIHDVAAISGYPVEPIKLGQQRTSLGAPLLRAGRP